MEARAPRELPSARPDVWALVAEPYHLPDWWPGYRGVRPDRRGLAADARWTVRRAPAAGFLAQASWRRPDAEGLIVITLVDPGLELRWHDVQQNTDVALALANAGEGRTRATVTMNGPWWRMLPEGGRDLPARSLQRLHDLCQTAADL
ncbi:MAG TPA: SRPBCC family protein [Gaiellaceae bacterium]|nr:SRPBCC family protein [Gaiellaceae bacterium]